MAQVSKKGTASTDTTNAAIFQGPTLVSLAPPSTYTLQGVPSTNGAPAFVAGEAIGAFDAVYIKKSDGLVYKSGGGSASALNVVVHGFALSQVFAAGDPVTIVNNCEASYMTAASAAAISVGAPLYVSEVTAGRLADAPGTYALTPVAYHSGNGIIRCGSVWV